MKHHHIIIAMSAFLLLGSCNPEKKGESIDTTYLDTSATDFEIDTTVADTSWSDSTVTDSLVQFDFNKMNPPGVEIREYPRPKDQLKQVRILYGTDRKETILNAPYVSYGSAPKDISETYKVGYTVITIPKSHKAGSIDRPSIWKLQFKEDSTKHMIQKSIVRLSDETFNDMLKSIDSNSEAFLFVHGYNNSFKDAALRAGQITEDIGLPIVPIMFSWSSNGAFLAYSSDEEKVRIATPAFINFLKRITVKGGYKKLHIIAHSMGNRLVSEAMTRLENDPIKLRIDQIIMAAPDLYAEEFRHQLAPAIAKRAKRVTVYAAPNDWALLTSAHLHKSLRFGQLGKQTIFAVTSVDIIDANQVKTDFLGHGTFAQSKEVMTDINKLITTSAAPALRGIQHEKLGSVDYYYFRKQNVIRPN